MSCISSNNYPTKGRNLDLKINNPSFIKDTIDSHISYKEIILAEWDMVMDDFDDGVGTRLLPHCTNCHRGVYKHDAGKWCTFCGALMKNPIAL